MKIKEHIDVDGTPASKFYVTNRHVSKHTLHVELWKLCKNIVLHIYTFLGEIHFLGS